MIDLVTVVFQDELSVLKVQAQSVDIYCQELGIKNIYVVVNDLDTVATKIDPSWWGSFKDHVRVLPRSVFGSQLVENGWVSQQALKILASSLSHNPWSMILDAKTIITDHVYQSIFLVDDVALTLGTYKIQSVFQPSADIASSFLGIEVDQVAVPMGVPFLFNTETVSQLTQHVEHTTGQSFGEWFQQQGMLTEFILYTAFVKYKHGDLTKVYKNTNRKKLCNNICHSEWQHFDRLLAGARDQRPLTIGVHRNAWTHLTYTQKQDYVDYLKSCQITEAQILL